MLKSAYKDAINKYVPDSALIESTKSAMRSEIAKLSLNDDKSAVIAVASQAGEKMGFWQKYGKFAAGAACIVLMVGAVVGVAAYLDNDDIKNNKDTFASSGHLGFDGNAANSGNGSVLVDITETTTSVTTTAVNVQSTQTQTTKALTTTSTVAQVQSTTTAQVTSATTQATAVQVVTTAKTTSATTKHTTTATTAHTSQNAVTTTTAKNPQQPPRPHFDYYDPQYDPNFNGGFGGDFAEEFLFEHQGIFYYFDMHKSDRVRVNIEGEEYSLREALDKKMVMPQDLLEFEGFICKGYYNDNKNTAPVTVHPEYEQQMQQQGGFMQAQDEMREDAQSEGYVENPTQDCDCCEETPQG